MEVSSSSQSSYAKRPIWHWILIYLIIGGLVYGLAYYFMYAKKGTSYTSPSLNENATTGTEGATLITLTKDGFAPKTVTIKAGTKVVWKNATEDTATINSVDHPSHTKHAFLNLGKFASGESLSLVFTNPGTYGYHNHNNSDNWGTVVVE